MLNDLGDSKKKAVELRFGLSDGKEHILKEIANDLAKSDARISEMIMYVRRKFYFNKRNEIFSCIHKPSEKFIREYFSKQDVFEIDNQQLSDDNKEELMNILDEEKKKKNVVQKEEVKTDEEEDSLEKLKLSNRSYNALRKIGIWRITELLDRVKSKEDLLKIKNIGKDCANEIIEKLDELGIKLEEQNKKKKKNIVPKEEAKTDEIEEDSLEKLKLSNRSYNALRKIGIWRITELLDRVKSKEDLLKIKNIGEGCANEIIEKLGKLGIRLEEQGEKITEENSDEKEERVRSALLELRGQREKMQELDEKIDELKKQRELYREQTAKGLEVEDEDGR